MAEVEVKTVGREWAVSLDGHIVGNFGVVTEALHYASLLECSPRARREAVG